MATRGRPTEPYSTRSGAREHGTSPMTFWRAVRAACVTDEARALLEQAGMAKRKWLTRIGRFHPDEQVEVAKHFIANRASAEPGGNPIIAAYVRATAAQRVEFWDAAAAAYADDPTPDDR